MVSDCGESLGSRVTVSSPSNSKHSERPQFPWRNWEATQGKQEYGPDIRS